MKLYESEVSTGNMSGKAGVPSIPFGRGFHQSGGNSGAPGIQFTPSGEPSFKTYKSMKHSKKNLKKMKKFKQYKESVTYDSLDIIGINFYDKEEGYVKVEIDGKERMEHFNINHAGYVHFQLFHPEEVYYQLVQYVYDNMPESDLKDSVLDNYEEVFQLEVTNEFFSNPKVVDRNIDDLKNGAPFTVLTKIKKFTDCTIEKMTGKSVLVKGTTQPEGEVRFWVAIEIFTQFRKGGFIMLPGSIKINLLTQDLKPLREDATATAGNSGGMGNVVAAQPSINPGSVNSVDSIPGSGDIGQVFGTYMKPALNLRKDKRKGKGMKKLTSFANFRP